MSQFFSAQQAVFRLKPSASAFVTYLASSGRGRDLTTTIALAMVACEMTKFPAGEVESPDAYFTDNAAITAAEAINVINELVPVDYRLALKLAKDMFLIRYESAYRPYKALGYDRSKGIRSIFGLSAHLSNDVLDCIQCNANEITEKYSRFQELVYDIKKD